MYTAIEDGFYPELQRVQALDAQGVIRAADAGTVQAALARPVLSEEDFLTLLSPAALPFLEDLARRAQAETLRNFGRGIQFFTPLYLANYCTNRCVYCGFSTKRDIKRRKLSLEEVEIEAKAIAATGLRKILALTGDAPNLTGASYLADCIRVLARHFSSVAIEVPSMTVEEYAMQVAAGADSMTMFQETYNHERYLELHPGGPKRDFLFRLDAPQRAIQGGMRSVNLGPLLGLDDWHADVLAVAAHARWLLRKYPQVEVSVSLPRMRPHTEGGEAQFMPLDVDNTVFVQILTALRCFLPQCGITMSSREPAWLRDKLLPLGVTRVSAGVCTAVGGHADAARQSCATAANLQANTGANENGEDKPQFDISDDRSVDEMAADLLALGYQPVFSDWLLGGQGADQLTGGVNQALGRS
ncbi:MAG: 2-iminoacetate synthase ThiH [Deltaproteobacteria bacterium]|jgi:2-iminoacetate synthase|nr:2-iminoacetate synthase ThiH [Deltaproteobacteria bacterium]